MRWPVFEPGQLEVRYRADIDGYGRLLQAVGEASHDSCLVLTSREAPPELVRLNPERSLALHGLGAAEAQVLLADWHLNADALAWLELVQRYGAHHPGPAPHAS